MTTLENENRMLIITEVVYLTGLAKSTIYKEIKTGKFPPPIKYGVASRWFLYDIRKFINGLKGAAA